MHIQYLDKIKYNRKKELIKNRLDHFLTGSVHFTLAAPEIETAMTHNSDATATTVTTSVDHGNILSVTSEDRFMSLQDLQQRKPMSLLSKH